MKSKTSTSFSISKEMWRGLRKATTPPKIKAFTCRVLHNATPVTTNLFKRRCALDAICLICNKREETLEHLFLECDWTNGVWYGSVF